ncbi:Cyclin-A2 [Phytophthora citrophthora]|uniref:Cyclin-A2 n=1 Tax=Phytophthora citrophthora TaxID=4793 RepID=A0AAD9FY81_9STRA|nr:Cyclin-A2 [Phytophthora citrophthora]
MVFTEISALVQSRWQLLRSAFDAEGHERRVQQRIEKKQAKQQRKVARRAAREARRAQRKLRHTLLSPTVVGDRTDDEDRQDSRDNNNTVTSNEKRSEVTVPSGASGLAWARTAEALTDVASANDSASFFKSEPSGGRRDAPCPLQDASPEYVATGTSYEKRTTTAPTTLAVAKAVAAVPELPMELALEIEAQLEQKQREFYDSLGGYSTVDEEDDELHELLVRGDRRVSDAKLPPKWTVVGIKKIAPITQQPEKEVFFKLPEEQEDICASVGASPVGSTSPLAKKPRPKSLSSSSELVETEPEDDEVDLRDSYSTFDGEEGPQDLFIANDEFDGLCAPPSSSLIADPVLSEATTKVLETKVDPSWSEADPEFEVEVEGKENDKLREIPTVQEVLETKHPSTAPIDFSGEQIFESVESQNKVSEGEPTEEEAEIVEDVKMLGDGVEMKEVSEVITVVEEEVIIEEIMDHVHPVDEDMFGQQTSILVLSSETFDQACAATPGVYSPGTVDEYSCSIYESLRAREHRYHVTEDIFTKQLSIRPKMRAVLVDWLVEVHQRFELEAQTLFLTVNYIDRYMAQAPVKSQKLQLVGVAALLIASKFEEIYPCDMDDLLYICERSYTKTDLVECERDLLNVFKFNLAVPSVSSFLGYYLEHFEKEDELIGQLACYFAEVSLLDFTFGATYESSVIACACILAAYCYVENQTPSLVWNSRLIELTGYAVEAIVPCSRDIWSILTEPSELTAVATKYSAKEFGEVAHLPLEDLEVLLC